MSKIELYYFSGTGNSLHVARELQKRIPETKLIPIISLLNKDIIETNGETVGFVFPIYLTTVPTPVKKFLKKIDLKSANYIFAIATRGGTLCLAINCMEKILKKKGKSLDSYFVLNMAWNSPVGLIPRYMPGAKDVAKNWINQITNENISKLESEVQIRLDSIQKVIINEQKNPEKDSNRMLNSFSRWLISSLMAPFIYLNEHKNIEIHFYTDSTCSGCGICEKVCLSKKIKIENDKPIWQKDIHCYFCYACFNCCPEQSILVKKAYTEKNGRYLHPAITPNNIAEQK